MYTIEYKNKSVHFPDDVSSSAASMYRQNMFYEFIFLRYIESLALGGAYLDVGAAWANHSLFFVRYCPASKVIAVEPVNDTARILDMNGGGDKIELLRVGASDRYEKAHYAGRDFDCVPLGEHPAVAAQKIGLIKIDIEGMELKAIRGLAKIIERDRPVLYCEAFDATGTTDIEDFLSTCDYVKTNRIFNLTPVHEFFPREKSGELVEEIDMLDRCGVKDGKVQVSSADMLAVLPGATDVESPDPALPIPLRRDRMTFAQLVLSKEPSELKRAMKVAYFDEGRRYLGETEYVVSNYRKMELLAPPEGAAYVLPLVAAAGEGSLTVHDFSVFSSK
ncbi:MAG: FkbM family methyltransferase [Pseudodesulfovibrio sp.]